MTNKIRRRPFQSTNRFQKKLLYPIILAGCFASFIGILCMLSIHLLDSPSQQILFFSKVTFKIFITWMMVGMCCTLFFILLWMYQVTHKIIGPFSRIVREMDEIIDGKRNGPLVVRGDDEMFAELLKRINNFVQN